jgi:hypothetical protein
LDLRDLLTLLLGGWISDRANGGAATSPAIASVAARSQEKLHSETQAGTFDPFAIDTKLPLLGEYILSAQQAHTYQLRTSANPLANTLVELGVVPSPFTAEALILWQLGYLGCPPPSNSGPEGIAGNALLLRANDDAVRTTCASVASAAHFGRCRVRWTSKAKRSLGVFLPMILLQSLRDLSARAWHPSNSNICVSGATTETGVSARHSLLAWSAAHRWSVRLHGRRSCTAGKIPGLEHHLPYLLTGHRLVHVGIGRSAYASLQAVCLDQQ